MSCRPSACASVRQGSADGWSSNGPTAAAAGQSWGCTGTSRATKRARRPWPLGRRIRTNLAPGIAWVGWPVLSCGLSALNREVVPEIVAQVALKHIADERFVVGAINDALRSI